MSAVTRVRVTIETDARALTPSGGVLRLLMAEGASIVVDREWPDVTVEDVAPERTWTDGDVVQSVSTGRAWVRGQTGWAASWADAEVSRGLQDGTYRVLRYQAGEQ